MVCLSLSLIQVEDTESVEKREDTELVKINKPAKEGQFIRPIGCDIKQGQVMLSEGDQIGPAEIGLLAGAGKEDILGRHKCTGITRLSVYRPPIVGILSTGDELVEPNAVPEKGYARIMKPN
jgi:gephyrin